jgi:hypothetical protein
MSKRNHALNMESLLVSIISIIIRVVNQFRNFFLLSFKWGEFIIIIIFSISLCSIKLIKLRSRCARTTLYNPLARSATSV